MARFSNIHLPLTSVAKVPHEADTVNADGKPAYKDSSLKQSVARLALTGVLKNQYYKKEDSVAKELVEICAAMAKEDPIFLLKAAKVSRDMNMKLFPKLALAAAIGSKTTPEQDKVVNEVAAKVLSSYQPNQLLEFVLVMKERQFDRGLGSRTQKIVSKAMSLSGKKRLEDWTIANREDMQRLVRLVHPKLDDMVRYVLDAKEGTENGKAITSRQSAMDAVKALANEKPQDWEMKVAALITEHKLPFNALKGVVGNAGQDVWDAIAENMSVLQLLLNLKSLDANKEVMTPAKLQRLLDAKFVSGKTRILPFDVMRASAHADARFKNTLSALIEKLALEPIPGLQNKKVGIVLDGSGSMGGPQSADSPWMNSMALVLPFLNNCEDRTFMIYSSELYLEGDTIKVPKFRRQDGADNFNKLAACFPGGGTNTGEALQHFVKNKIKLDVLVLITDEQQNGHEHAYQVWAEYRKKVAPDAQLVVVNPTNYEWHLASNLDGSVTFVQSLTPAIYRLVEYKGQDVVAVIENTELSSTTTD